MHQEKILIIEDDEILVDSIQKRLTDDKERSYLFQFCNNGKVGWEIGLKWEPDLIILDLHLPGVHGYKILRDFAYQRPLTKILVISNSDSSHDIAYGLNQGCDSYLGKPVDLEVLMATIKALLRRGKLLDDVNLLVDDIFLSTKTRQLVRSGKKYSLTIKEFALLHYLMRRPGEVVKRDELLNQLWKDKNSFPNTVDVYMDKLRQIIDKPYNSHYLQTAYRQGYYFNPNGSDDLIGQKEAK